MAEHSWLRFWGKSRDDGSAPLWHPLAYHSLDVAACGHLLLERDDLRRRRLAEQSGIGEAELLPWSTFLLALHDVGKFADGFQGLRPDLLAALQGRSTPALYPERHDLLGYRLLSDVRLGFLRGPDAPFAGALSADDWSDLLEPWWLATAGHHGRPPRPREPRELLARQFPAPVLSAARSFVRECAALLLPGGRLGPPAGDLDELCERGVRASWWFAGLAVAADWLGSNAAWFPFHPPSLDLEQYWSAIALPRARRALEESGFLPRPVAPSRGLSTFFDLPVPTPLQALATSIELAPGPQLFVLEEVTGGGKTEAALVLAHRLMAEGQANGIYFGLPTMATANAMYSRIEAAFRRLYADDARASLVLAHSRNDLFSPRAPLESAPRDRPYGGEESTASATCSAWLGDSRKKALLAHVGVGTIDQALLGILPVRHQSLRLWGLADKVLIVDEVHAYDTYTRQLLDELLRFHAAAGGSAILLSATLPAGQRRELLQHFAAGAGYPKPSAEPSGAYPLLTHLHAGGPPREEPVAARTAASRTVGIRWLVSAEEVDASLAEVLEADGCACWIRNTVEDAREVYELWKGRLGEDRVFLFHSRFTVGDRIEIERRVLDTFGKMSRAEARCGRLLIATQVVEQSLDLDLDYLVTDLCPIDLVVQRAGRLRRHARDRAGNPVAGTDLRGPVVLGVFGPGPLDDPPQDWYAAALPRGSFVYDDHGRLWLTARWLQLQGRFAMPEDGRALIEAVYGEASDEAIPAGLRGRADRAGVADKSDRALARINALKLAQGYKATDLDWEEDVHYETRMGLPSVILRLVAQRDGRFEPWFKEGELYRRWRLSEVQAPASWVSGEDPALTEEELAALKAAMPGEGKFCRLTLLRETAGDSWQGRGTDAKGEEVTLIYSQVSGLSRLALK